MVCKLLQTSIKFGRWQKFLSTISLDIDAVLYNTYTLKDIVMYLRSGFSIADI